MIAQKPPPLPAVRQWRAMKRKALFAGSVIAVFLVALYLRGESRVRLKVIQTIICPRDSPIMEKDTQRFVVAAKVMNTGREPLRNPSFFVYLDSQIDSGQHIGGDEFIGPGQTWYYVTPEFQNAPLGSLKNAPHAEAEFQGNDNFVPESYANYELNHLPEMKFTVTSMEFASTNDSCTIRGTFKNRSGENVTMIAGAALFFDSEGNLVDCSRIEYDPHEDHPYGVWIDNVPGAARATRCVVQINEFRSTGYTTPESIPPLPSVH